MPNIPDEMDSNRSIKQVEWNDSKVGFKDQDQNPLDLALKKLENMKIKLLEKSMNPKKGNKKTNDDIGSVYK